MAAPNPARCPSLPWPLPRLFFWVQLNGDGNGLRRGSHVTERICSLQFRLNGGVPGRRSRRKLRTQLRPLLPAVPT